MHQQSSMLNFSPFFQLSRTSGVTSSVLKNVTMGLGASIQSSNAAARLVALGSTAVGLIAVLLWRWIHIRLCS